MITPKLRFLAATLLAALLFCASPLRAPAEHRESWIEIRSPHFTVISNAGEHDGRRVALQFEEVRAMFEQIFPKLKVDSGKPTIVFALKNEDSLKLLLPSYGQNSKSMHIAGFYQPGYDKNFAVVRTDVVGTGALNFHSLYHEYTHAFFRYNFRGLPLWLDEGLAEFYGNTSKGWPSSMETPRLRGSRPASACRTTTSFVTCKPLPSFRSINSSPSIAVPRSTTPTTMPAFSIPNPGPWSITWNFPRNCKSRTSLINSWPRCTKPMTPSKPPSKLSAT